MSSLLQTKSDRPIDATSLAAIQAVMTAAAELGLAPFLIGATARIILLEHVFGLPPGRATRDIDFAFSIESWAQFHGLKQHLQNTASFTPVAGAEQRLRYQAMGMTHSLVIDIIPFGGLETGSKQIAWPPDMSILMSVAGYREAQAAAISVEVAPGLQIKLASLPAIAILKLFAWLDRGREDPKDALDLFTLLRQYHEAGNQVRLYESESALEAADYDLEYAGAWLLGRDASALVLPDTRQQLAALFADRERIEDLVTDMSRAIVIREDALDYARALLAQFQKGVFAA